MGKRPPSREIRQPSKMLQKRRHSWRPPQQTKSTRGDVCVARRCRKVAARLEKYRILNAELTQEVATLRTSDRCNREFQIMFDRFTLKFAQSVPRVQVLKKRLEESYDTLQELEEMINCFSNADRLRSFLLGEESFNFGVTGTVNSEPTRSPLIKEPPPREHRRFDENGEMDTIIEEYENSSTASLSIATKEVNSRINGFESETEAEESVISLPPQASINCGKETSKFIAQNMESEPNHKNLQTQSMKEVTTRGTNRCVTTTHDGSRRNSFQLTEPPLLDNSRRSARRSFARAEKDKPAKTSSRHKQSASSIVLKEKLRLEETFEDESGPLFKTSIPLDTSIATQIFPGPKHARSKTLLGESPPSTTVINNTIPVAGKSDEDFSQCADSTSFLSESPGPTAAFQDEIAAERSPTAINVAQIWAEARAGLPPAERSPTCTGVGAAWLEALQSVHSPSNIEDGSFLAPLATTMVVSKKPPLFTEYGNKILTTDPCKSNSQTMISPVNSAESAIPRSSESSTTLLVLPRNGRLPTSTPANSNNKSNGGVVKPSSPRLSIIELRPPFERVDDNKMDFLQQQNVDRRPRKRKATVQQRSPTRTKDQHVTSTVSSLSPWKSALRASYEAQNNFGGQTNALTKNVRFSNINKVNPTQRQMEAVVYSSPSAPAEPTNLNVSEFSNEKFPPIALINSPLIKGSRATASKSRRKHRIAPDCAKAIFDNADSNDRTINEEAKNVTNRSRRIKEHVACNELSPSSISGLSRQPSCAKSPQTKITENTTISEMKKTFAEKTIERNPRVTYVVSRQYDADGHHTKIQTGKQQQEPSQDYMGEINNASVGNNEATGDLQTCIAETGESTVVDNTTFVLGSRKRKVESPVAKRSRCQLPADNNPENVAVKTSWHSTRSASPTKGNSHSKECNISADNSSVLLCPAQVILTSDAESRRNRSSRRTSAIVSYVEPSLRVKMRRN
ncbi:uncharacterized protein LOC111270740 [Varroa jacobsoni]|uniref:uncharacterized protein LOC111270740 n=1 Tax=Varroa jacobsoni TaxID=62625 RepID=UPI000BF84DAE|nr:uncharacterized protein LOC111270740 [Varroa jacobsoni]